MRMRAKLSWPNFIVAQDSQSETRSCGTPASMQAVAPSRVHACTASRKAFTIVWSIAEIIVSPFSPAQAITPHVRPIHIQGQFLGVLPLRSHREFHDLPSTPTVHIHVYLPSLLPHRHRQELRGHRRDRSSAAPTKRR